MGLEKKQGHEGKEDSLGLMFGCTQTQKLRPHLSSRFLGQMVGSVGLLIGRDKTLKLTAIHHGHCGC